jgi:hypothetical protein
LPEKKKPNLQKEGDPVMEWIIIADRSPGGGPARRGWWWIRGDRPETGLFYLMRRCMLESAMPLGNGAQLMREVRWSNLCVLAIGARTLWLVSGHAFGASVHRFLLLDRCLSMFQAQLLDIHVRNQRAPGQEQEKGFSS